MKYTSEMWTLSRAEEREVVLKGLAVVVVPVVLEDLGAGGMMVERTERREVRLRLSVGVVFDIVEVAIGLVGDVWV